MENAPMMMLLGAASAAWILFGIAMLVLSIWLFRRTQISGSAMLMGGYGALLFTQAVSRIAPMFTQYSTTGDDSMYLAVLAATSWLGVACNIVVAIGFYLMCRRLIEIMRTSASNASTNRPAVSGEQS